MLSAARGGSGVRQGTTGSLPGAGRHRLRRRAPRVQHPQRLPRRHRGHAGAAVHCDQARRVAGQHPRGAGPGEAPALLGRAAQRSGTPRDAHWPRSNQRRCAEREPEVKPLRRLTGGLCSRCRRRFTRQAFDARRGGGLCQEHQRPGRLGAADDRAVSLRAGVPSGGAEPVPTSVVCRCRPTAGGGGASFCWASSWACSRGCCGPGERLGDRCGPAGCARVRAGGTAGLPAGTSTCVAAPSVVVSGLAAGPRA